MWCSQVRNGLSLGRVERCIVYVEHTRCIVTVEVFFSFWPESYARDNGSRRAWHYSVLISWISLARYRTNVAVLS